MADGARKNRTSERVDFILLMVIVTLLLFGLIMLFSASSPRALDAGNIYSVILKQGALAIIGCAGMFLTANFDYHRYKKMSRLIMVGTLVIMYIVPIIGFASHGATRQI